MTVVERGWWRTVLPGVICLTTLLMSASAADVSAIRPSLDQGFRLLYNLDFDQGNQVFVDRKSVV
jgi:hypothetical protein